MSLERLIEHVAGNVENQGRHHLVRAVDMEEVIQHLRRLRGIQLLMGYVGNGSDTPVEFYQDDATRDYFVTVGKKAYFGGSFNEALDKAIADYKPEDYGL